MVHSLNKGKRGERLWRDILKLYGFKARRGQQFSGSPDSPDVVSEELRIHWEVKNVENLNIHDALDQATRDAGNAIPVVAHKKNKKGWKITLSAVDFMQIIKELYESNRSGHIKAPEKDR